MRGPLPEIWGFVTMSAATKRMLSPPVGRRLDEDCPDFERPTVVGETPEGPTIPSILPTIDGKDYCDVNEDCDQGIKPHARQHVLAWVACAKMDLAPMPWSLESNCTDIVA